MASFPRLQSGAAATAVSALFLFLFLHLLGAAECRADQGTTVLDTGAFIQIVPEPTEAEIVGGQLREEYCCLKNGLNQCKQTCTKGQSYSCCLKNGFGCQQLCLDGVDYSCCLQNGFGCQGMCPTGKPNYCCAESFFGCQQMCWDGPKLTSSSDA